MMSTNIYMSYSSYSIRFTAFRTSIKSSHFLINAGSVPRYMYFEQSSVSDSTFGGSYEYCSGSNMTVVYSKFTNTSISLLDSDVTIVSSQMSSNAPIRMRNGLISCSSIVVNAPSNSTAMVASPCQSGYYQEGFSILNSTISGSQTGVRINTPLRAPTVFSNTNFVSNSLYNVENVGPCLINATGNWWGTTTDSIIQAKILDGRDNIELGEVSYYPYANQPIIQTCIPTNLPWYRLYSLINDFWKSIETWELILTILTTEELGFHFKLTSVLPYSTFSFSISAMKQSHDFERRNLCHEVQKLIWSTIG